MNEYAEDLSTGRKDVELYNAAFEISKLANHWRREREQQGGGSWKKSNIVPLGHDLFYLKKHRRCRHTGHQSHSQ